MKKLVVLAVLILALSASMAMAWTGTEIQGSAAISALGGVTRDNPTFNLSKLFTVVLLVTTKGTGDFSSVTGLQVVNTPATPSTTTLDLDNLDHWTFGNAEYGTWTTTGGHYDFIPVSGSIFLNVALTGTFTPGTFFTGKTANDGVMNISLTKSGASTSFSGTMDLEALPEASTLVGFGSSLAMAAPGLIGWLRKRRA